MKLHIALLVSLMCFSSLPSPAQELASTEDKPAPAQEDAAPADEKPAPAEEKNPARDGRPNVVLIIADDLGYGETGMMGNREIPTPHIDALANSGLRCTAGYVTASYCSPSRAGIMTGRYQSRFGYEMNPTGKRNLHKAAGLPEAETTFVTRLSQAGYSTGLIGKWHLGTSASKVPTKRGFDHFYGFLHEGHFYVPGPAYEGVLTMVRDTSVKEGQQVREQDLIRGNYARIDEPKYDEDNPILRGDKKIEESRYLTDAITEEAVDFIAKNAGQKPFCLVVSYSAVHSPMQAKSEDLQSLQRIKNVQRRIFAGMLTSLDRGVGRIRKALDDQSLTRRTLVVFVSDNGGPTEELTSSNAPLRGGKGSLYEGGIRVPMLWSFPNRIPAERIEDRPVLSLDIAATALDVAGLEVDKNMDGKSLLGWINQPSRDYPHETIFWRMEGGQIALRHGDWKIVRPSQNASIELYHLAGDPSESRNVASDHPEKMKELVNKWFAIDTEMAKPIELPE
jgi:arylsulfatase A-like enzyme